jgi:RNA polymerase sigma factor (sigma-70 family)
MSDAIALDQATRTRTAEIYTEHYRFVLSVCRSILKDQEEAREAAQDVFIKVLKSLAGFEGLCQVKTWVYRITINECYSRLAAWKRKRESLSRYVLQREVDQEAQPVGSYRPILAQGLFRKQLETAGEATKKVLYMYVDQGLSQRDIADCLGVSRVAITRRITRFREVVARGEARTSRRARKPVGAMAEMGVRQAA